MCIILVSSRVMHWTHESFNGNKLKHHFLYRLKCFLNQLSISIGHSYGYAGSRRVDEWTWLSNQVLKNINRLESDSNCKKKSDSNCKKKSDSNCKKNQILIAKKNQILVRHLYKFAHRYVLIRTMNNNTFSRILSKLKFTCNSRVDGVIDIFLLKFWKFEKKTI